MARCTACDSELQSDALFCSVCGAQVAQPTSTNATHARVAELTADEEYLKIFVGDRFEEVSLKWKAFKKGDYVGAWNWPAFIFGAIWLAYRKMYVYSAICFLFSNVPGAISWVMFLEETNRPQNSTVVDIAFWTIGVINLVISVFLGVYGSKSRSRKSIKDYRVFVA